MYLSVLLNTRSIGLEAWSKMAQHGHGACSQKWHGGMPIGMPFCDVAYLMSGHQLHSQYHCKNHHVDCVELISAYFVLCS